MDVHIGNSINAGFGGYGVVLHNNIASGSSDLQELGILGLCDRFATLDLEVSGHSGGCVVLNGCDYNLSFYSSAHGVHCREDMESGSGVGVDINVSGDVGDEHRPDVVAGSDIVEGVVLERNGSSRGDDDSVSSGILRSAINIDDTVLDVDFGSSPVNTQSGFVDGRIEFDILQSQIAVCTQTKGNSLDLLHIRINRPYGQVLVDKKDTVCD